MKTAAYMEDRLIRLQGLSEARDILETSRYETLDEHNFEAAQILEHAIMHIKFVMDGKR